MSGPAGLPALARSVAVLVLLLLALCADFIWGALYHYAYEPLVLAGVLAAYAALFCALAYGAARLIGHAPARWLLDFASLQLFAYLAMNVVRRLAPGAGTLAPAFKVLLVLASLGAALWLLMRAGHALRLRLVTAMGVASVLFLLTPPLAVALMAPALAFPLAPVGAAAAPPVLVLLLDELGDQAAQPLHDALQQRGLSVVRRAVAPPGENTVNAIPALLTGRDFGAAQACSLSAVCSGAQMLDFARMRSAEPRLDIVGFHHPYCRIGGLRYCHQALTPGIENPFAWFGCVLVKAVARRAIDACDRRLLTVRQVNAARADILDAVGRAPFWREGGVLFVHHPLPHPPARAEGQSLDTAYAANLAEAAQLAASLAQRLEASFGRRYAMVITSDHPLRPAVWCAMARYAAHGCAVRPAFADSRVPLLLAMPAAELASGLDGVGDPWALVNRLRGAAAGTAP